MTNVLPLIWGGSARQHDLSPGGAAMTAPPSPSRPSPTSINASSSRKPSSPRAKRSHFEGIPDRTRYYKVSARDGTDVDRTCRPRQHRTGNRGSNIGLQEAKPIINRDSPTPYYSASAWQGFKLPVSAFPFRRTVTPQPALRVSQLSHLSVTKTKEPTPDQLPGSKSSKDLPTLATDFPRGIADENVSARRPEKKGDSLLHDSAIPIPFGDVLLRSPSPQTATAGQGLCGKADGSVLEGLIGVQEKDIKPLCPWDEADSEVVDVDGKTVPSTVPRIITSTVLESMPESSERIYTEIKSVVGKAHSDDNSDDDESNDNDNDSSVSSHEGSSVLECNGYKHRGSQTTDQALSDTPESGVNWSTGSESFRASGYGDAPSFGGLTPSSSGGKAFQGQDKNALGVGSGIDSSQVKLPPRRLVCWFAAAGRPCSDGKVFKSPEVRHIIRDHCYSDKSPHHHRLVGKCIRCNRLFVDESSWAQHKLKVREPRSCEILSPSDVAIANYGPSQDTMSTELKDDIEQAMKQYRHKDQILPSQCTKDDHDAWIESNYKLYICESSVTEKKARGELGLWLVGWFTLFPDKPIPDDPFFINNVGPSVCQEISDQTRQSIVEQLQKKLYTTLGQDCLDIIEGGIKDALRNFQQRQNAETVETSKPKRRRVRTSTTAQPQLDSTANLAPLTSQDYFVDLEPYPMAISLSTPGPYNGTFVDSAYPPSSADSFNIDPKLWEKEAHTNEGGRPEPDPEGLNFVGSRFDGQRYPKVNYMAQSNDESLPKDGSINPCQTVPEGLGAVQEFCRNNPPWSGC